MNLETLKALYSQVKRYEDRMWMRFASQNFLIAREERKQK